MICMGPYLVVCVATVALADAAVPEGWQSPLRLELEAHRDTPTSPDLLGDPDAPIVALQMRTAGELCATVFGFLPYWESSANIRWDLISHVACFSVEVNANGTLGSDHGWPWTSVINTAHANGVKVILVATLFNNDSITTLINSETYKNNFFVNIRNKMLEGGADGLNVDFEVGGGGDTSWRGQIHEFLADLTEYLHAQIPGSEVTFDGPAVNWSSAFDLFAVADSCDGIFIMGYAFAGSWSTTSGPNAPLTGGSINITDTVLDEYYPATQIIPEKLILGVPYYGGHWTTTSSAARSTVIDWIGSTRFRDDQPNSEYYGRLWDTTSQTPWYRWNDGTNWHQVWYDDAESLGLKYQLAQDHDLQGVGMWALNYDGTRDELWDELEARFVDACCADYGDPAGVVIYQDDFDAGTSGLTWDLYTSSSDYTADFAFDYSVHGIPPAPNSQGGSTIGVKFTVNNNDSDPTTEAVSAYPAGQSFGDYYALKFDMWINYNGGAGGGSGSTEFMTAGINHSGTRVCWPNNPASDGYYFAVSGEGGSSTDYRAYDGASEYSLASGVYVAVSQNNSDSLYQHLLPSPEYETQGSPGKHWVSVEVRQTGGRIEWRLNGTPLAEVPNPSVTSGNVMIGYMDPFTSLANPAEDNFIIYDNVRVEQLPDPDCNENGVADACETIGGGDYDADGVVDLDDFAALRDCLAGPDLPPAPAKSTCGGVCLEAFDADGDGDLDLYDVAAFQEAFTG
jgi:spore germination protein YaaH